MAVGVGVGEGIGEAGENLLQALIARDERERSEAAISKKLMLPIMAQAEQNKIMREHDVRMENLRTEREMAQKAEDRAARLQEKQMDIQSRAEIEERGNLNALKIALLNAKSKGESGAKVGFSDITALENKLRESILGKDFDPKGFKQNKESLKDLKIWNQADVNRKQFLLKSQPANKNFAALAVLESNPPKQDVPWWPIDKRLPITTQDQIQTLNIDEENLARGLAEERITIPGLSGAIGWDEPSLGQAVGKTQSLIDSLLADTSATGILRSVAEEIYGMPQTEEALPDTIDQKTKNMNAYDLIVGGQ